MDFEAFFASVTAALVIVLRRFLLLIFFPYRTMRSISLRSNRYQVIAIFFLALCYFLLAHSYRHSFYLGFVAFIIFLALFYITVIFFYFLSIQSKEGIHFNSFVYTFSYTLIPTLFWFYTTFILFIILPPPRTYSLLGTGFSIFFVAYSLSLLAWKMILVYLAVRFSSRQGIYRIIYMLLLYILIVFPLSVFFYYQRLFRIPFI